MAVGSFIAGASSEGGGAVAFPVLTLVYNLAPDLARNFSLAIQSIGMTSASFFILAKRIPIEKRYLILATIGGTIGICIGTFYLANLFDKSYVKMFFFSFWLSFGFVLLFINQIKTRLVNQQLPKLVWYEKLLFLLVGIIGGILSSMLGNGLDILTFSFVTLRYNLSEKIGVPTSVIIMAINSIVGFSLHLFVLEDISSVEYNYWLVSIPIVIFGAPLGSYFISKLNRLNVVNFIYAIIVIQFISACFIIKPEDDLLLFSIGVFVFGLLLFTFFSKSIPLYYQRNSASTVHYNRGRIAYDNDQSYWKKIVQNRNYIFTSLVLWISISVLSVKGNVEEMIISPIPIYIAITSVCASLIANSTAAGGGIIFFPIFSMIFLEYIASIVPANSFYLTKNYDLPEIIIAIHFTQACGMLAGSFSWWRRGVKILKKENMLNFLGVFIGILVGNYVFKIEADIVFKIFAFTNIVFTGIISYNYLLKRKISLEDNWPDQWFFVFFIIGLAGGLLSVWTSIGIGSITSLILLLIVKPEISVANGSIMMASTSIIIVILHFFKKGGTIPFEIIGVSVPCVIMGGYGAPFFAMWLGRVIFKLKFNTNLFNAEGIIIELGEQKRLELKYGQFFIIISFILIGIWNGIYFLLIK